MLVLMEGSLMIRNAEELYHRVFGGEKNTISAAQGVTAVLVGRCLVHFKRTVW